ncbi:hypothetical protein ACKE5C_18925 (plasmid) [Aneurinibacillus thermoaerophilus]|uniref:Uncharacterized protein n=1 Tax=Aneurinibacillus thermoaerophilus TaxID=143495 RepID=A0ABX8YGE2_ANETH|nr:hypothetical protein [Aneurinibacillus thermoaerophilus]QYY44729.1 hypothetical protein K3F53_18975 [Aneurinibacillus thermoaerophilus]
MKLVYVSRLMKASEVREACENVKQMPDVYFVETSEQKEKAARSAGNTLTA